MTKNVSEAARKQQHTYDFNESRTTSSARVVAGRGVSVTVVQQTHGAGGGGRGVERCFGRGERAGLVPLRGAVLCVIEARDRQAREPHEQHGAQQHDERCQRKVDDGAGAPALLRVSKRQLRHNTQQRHHDTCHTVANHHCCRVSRRESTTSTRHPSSTTHPHHTHTHTHISLHLLHCCQSQYTSKHN